MKYLILSAAFLGSFTANASIDGKTFVDCFKKALEERVAEIKKERPDVEVCSTLKEAEIRRLYGLYGKVYEDGKFRFYSARAMGLESVRFHYDRIKYEFECYEIPNNIASDFVLSFGAAIGLTDENNHDLTEQALTKMLGREMWTENGSDVFSAHQFDYCKTK